MSHSFKEMLLKFNTKRRPAFLECTFLQILLERKIWVGVVYFSAFVCLNVMTLIFFPLSLLLFFFFFRGTSPTHRKTSDVIQEAINLSRNDRIDVKSLRSLQQVSNQNNNMT